MTYERVNWSSIPVGTHAVTGRWIIGRSKPRWNGFLCGWIGHPKAATIHGGIKCDRCGVLAVYEPVSTLHPWGWNEP